MKKLMVVLLSVISVASFASSRVVGSVALKQSAQVQQSSVKYIVTAAKSATIAAAATTKMTMIAGTVTSFVG